MIATILSVLLLMAPVPTTQQSDDVSPDIAELAMLRQACARQAEEIAQLRSEVTRLGKIIKDAGIEVAQPVEQPISATTEPTTKPVSPRRVIYLLDTSGSMINRIAIARSQIQRAISNLPADAMFNVLSTSDEKPLLLFQTPRRANDQSKRAAYDFLSQQTTGGATDPAPALTTAFSLRPAEIWFITDGDFPDQKAILRVAEEAKKRQIKINTIAKWDKGGTMDVLYQISKLTGGKAIDLQGAQIPDPQPSKPAPAPTPQPAGSGKSIFDE